MKQLKQNGIEERDITGNEEQQLRWYASGGL
jgi:hypothetical protein